MRLLFDQNLSFKLVKLVNELFPDSTHVKFHQLEFADDITVWQFAKSNDLTIVSQDVDFYDIGFLNGFPPKIIWIRTGNKSTKYIYKALLDNHMSIMQFFDSKSEFCLEIY